MVVQPARRGAGHQARGAERAGRHAQLQQQSAAPVTAAAPGAPDAREPPRRPSLENHHRGAHTEHGDDERPEPYILPAGLQRQRADPGQRPGDAPPQPKRQS